MGLEVALTVAVALGALVLKTVGDIVGLAVMDSGKLLEDEIFKTAVTPVLLCAKI